ncbi:type II toxin-antitoxin system VapC family toxin [bacterium]|nr:type II toxin-antitoxin system VapC family toxin [bacterium]
MTYLWRTTWSVITRAEVLAGASDEDEPAVRSLLDSFDCLDITPAVADLAALLCRTGRLRQPDAFQAALALAHGLHLVTRNTKCFSERSHPFVSISHTLSS